jgi:hypothetical protein
MQDRILRLQSLGAFDHTLRLQSLGTFDPTLPLQNLGACRIIFVSCSILKETYEKPPQAALPFS